MKDSNGIKITLSQEEAKALFTILDTEYSLGYAYFVGLSDSESKMMGSLADKLRDVGGGVDGA